MVNFKPYKYKEFPKFITVNGVQILVKDGIEEAQHLGVKTPDPVVKVDTVDVLTVDMGIPEIPVDGDEPETLPDPVDGSEEITEPEEVTPPITEPELQEPAVTEDEIDILRETADKLGVIYDKRWGVAKLSAAIANAAAPLEATEE